MKIRLPAALALLVVCSATGLQTGCASNPATGGTDVVVMSRGKENSIGDKMYKQLVDDGAIYEDVELQAYVNRIGQRLVVNSDQPNAKFTFNVIDSPDINAFATPGGYVYINRGLMAYLDNEAELAGVLGHEIGHITARHAGRQQTANITSKVLAATVGILTNSRDVYDASNMYSTELIRGYGREHELEADTLGARYLNNSGYDSYALLEVIGVLKDQQQFQQLKARAAGKQSATYHGLYATHPRNDLRLQTVIRTASQQELENPVDDPELPGEFRRHLEGMVWGDSIQSKRADNRFYHNKLKFTFEHPAGWKVATGSKAITATAADGSASMTISLRKIDQSKKPRKMLESSAVGTLSKGKKLEQAGLSGYTAIASAVGKSKRLAVLDYNNLSYLFEGEGTEFGEADKSLLAIVESFRPMHPKEKKIGPPRYLHYVQVPRGATIASIAATMRIPHAEQQLRLMNGFYPRGEPRIGDWIKIVKH